MAGVAANSRGSWTSGEGSRCADESVDLRDSGALSVLGGDPGYLVGNVQPLDGAEQGRQRRIGTYRRGSASKPVRVDTSSDPFRLWLRRQFCGLGFERLLAIFTSPEGLVLAYEWIDSGDAVAIATPVRRLITRALSVDARQMILAHNHPSGNPEPSQVDITTTRRLVDLVTPLGIKFVDHFIVTEATLTSCRERGIL